MARVWVDGFESGSLVNYTCYANGLGSGDSFIAENIAGMTGRYCMGMTYVWGTARGMQLDKNYSELYMMFRYKYYGYHHDPAGCIVYFLDENDAPAGSISCGNSLRLIKAYIGDTYLDTGTTPIFANIVYRIEIHIKPSSSGGIFRVKVDGRPIELDYAGAMPTDVGSIRKVMFYGDGFTTFYFDDIIVDDSNWIGNSIVKGIVPIGTGYHSEWIPSTNTTPTTTAVTKLLLHFEMEGDDPYETIDSSEYAHTIAFYQSGYIDDFYYKFGEYSLNSYTGYVTTEACADWNFGTSKFTIDFWVRFSAVTLFGQGLFASYLDADNFWRCEISSSKIALMVFVGGAVVIAISGDWVPSADVFYHVAVIRGWGGDSSKFAITIDGSPLTLTGATTTVAMPAFSRELAIGVSAGQSGYQAFSLAYIDEFRVSSGTVWTAPFTPPTVQYSAQMDAASITNWSLVDEIPPVDTDYVYTNIKNAMDSYEMEDLVDPVAGIRSVSVHARCRHLGEPEPKNIQLLYRGDSTDYTSPSKWVPDSYSQTNYHIWETNPSTGSTWQLEEVNDAEFGVKAVE